jgi:hypothetical protein
MEGGSYDTEEKSGFLTFYLEKMRERREERGRRRERGRKLLQNICNNLAKIILLIAVKVRIVSRQ